jgi:hypothetical protein
MRAEKMRATYDLVAGEAADPAQQDPIMFRRADVKPESLPWGRPPSRPR